MSIVFNLESLPELQRLDRRRRRHAVLDWRIELWRHWIVYFAELGTFIGVIAFGRMISGLVVGSTHWRWYWDFAWICPSVLVALVVRNHVIYLRRRDVLAKILARPEYNA